MVGKSGMKGMRRFELKPPDGTRTVAVAGDFSDWEPISMRRQKAGVFVRHLKAPRTTFEYKFIVDGEWICDPDNPHRVPDCHGAFNSVAPAGAKSVPPLRS